MVLSAVLSHSACDEPPKVIDPYPIPFDRSAGPVLLAASTVEDEPFNIVLDVLSPVTVLDSYVEGQVLPPPKRKLVELTLFGLDTDSSPSVPRVRFPESAVLDVHPCGRSEPCYVGLDATQREFKGVLGSDILSRSAIRFDFPRDTLRFFPDTAGSDAQHTENCEAVFSSPFAGGGQLSIGGDELPYSGRRPTLGLCLADEEPEALEDYGVDMQIALSTALGPSLLTKSAYQRYRRRFPAPPLAELPGATLHLLSGPTRVQLVEIPFFALSGDVGEDSKGRGPCRERFANHAMAEDACNAYGICPCRGNDLFCKASAAIEVTTPTLFAVVDDNLALIQALRDELRPTVAELDGILGVDALGKLRVEFDYPNNRLLMRCLESENCTTLPQVRGRNAEYLTDCKARADADL